MASNSKIEWCEATWSPITGCSPVSEGCQNCYAKRMATRLKGRCGYPADDPFKVTFHPDRLDQPLRWKKPKRIFVCSMGDLFHEDIDTEWIMRIFGRIYKLPQHTFILLTKRPENALSFCRECGLMPSNMPSPCCSTPSGVEWPQNAWLGVTAENQQRADERIPILLQIPAAKRFVSVEPMLGPIDFEPDYESACRFGQEIHWVICGGETGPGARPMQSNWARSLRDQCKGAGVPFFFKKHGDWWCKNNGCASDSVYNREFDGNLYWEWPS
jgi:protein gp37